MNRQNNLKIIITTVIVLVISAIAVFTVVNWAEIVRKFQGAAAKNDGFEKHERNTVPPNNTTGLISTNSKDETKSLSSDKPVSDTKNPSKDDTTKINPKSKEQDPYGLEEPATLKPKDSNSPFKVRDNDEYPMGNENFNEKKNTVTPDKKAHVAKVRNYKYKKYRRKARVSKSNLVKVKNLDKRVTYLEKKLGVKKPITKKKTSLENRIYQLEKLITKKK